MRIMDKLRSLYIFAVQERMGRRRHVPMVRVTDHDRISSQRAEHEAAMLRVAVRFLDSNVDVYRREG